MFHASGCSVAMARSRGQKIESDWKAGRPRSPVWTIGHPWRILAGSFGELGTNLEVTRLTNYIYYHWFMNSSCCIMLESHQVCPKYSGNNLSVELIQFAEFVICQGGFCRSRLDHDIPRLFLLQRWFAGTVPRWVRSDGITCSNRWTLTCYEECQSSFPRFLELTIKGGFSQVFQGPLLWFFQRPRSNPGTRNPGEAQSRTEEAAPPSSVVSGFAGWTIGSLCSYPMLFSDFSHHLTCWNLH